MHPKSAYGLAGQSSAHQQSLVNAASPSNAAPTSTVMQSAVSRLQEERGRFSATLNRITAMVERALGAEPAKVGDGTCSPIPPGLGGELHSEITSLEWEVNRLSAIADKLAMIA